MVHGILHLLGYDHETDAEADDMEAAGDGASLRALGIADPYAGSPELANSDDLERERTILAVHAAPTGRRRLAAG